MENIDRPKRLTMTMIHTATEVQVLVAYCPIEEKAAEPVEESRRAGKRKAAEPVEENQSTVALVNRKGWANRWTRSLTAFDSSTEVVDMENKVELVLITDQVADGSSESDGYGSSSECTDTDTINDSSDGSSGSDGYGSSSESTDTYRSAAEGHQKASRCCSSKSKAEAATS